MVRIEELDKKGKKVKRVVEYSDEESDDSYDDEEDNIMVDLDALEMLMDGVDDGDEDEDEDDEDDDNSEDIDEEDEMMEDDDTDNDDNDDDDEEDENDDEDSGEDEDDSNESDNDSHAEEKDLDDQEHENATPSPHQDHRTLGQESCVFDLRNLVAVNSHQLDYKTLYSTHEKYSEKDQTKTKSNAKVTIDMDKVHVNEDYLLQKASEGCSQLIHALWQLNTEKSDAGPIAILPKYFEIPTPRALPPPPPKVETKWEKFMKERGIAPKAKRSRKVWDEATQSWAHLTGSGKASSDKEWPIMEVKRNEDPFEDPWQRARDSKKARVQKNTENQMRNQERAGTLVKGTATRTIKAVKLARDKGREGGNQDTLPAGLPVDLSSGKKRGKELTKAALVATQRSTASFGKFDEMREGEPERKAIVGLKKRKFEDATSKSAVMNEANKSLKVLDKVIGGSKQKEKDAKKGKFAKGETAYDYDFNDGLGASTFKKKKGRAGGGKMKKITKKRIK